MSSPFSTDSPFLPLRPYWRMFRERWWMGVLAGLLIGAGFFAWFITQPPLYRSTSKLMFKPASDNVINFLEVVDTSLRGGEARLRTHVMEIQSQQFFRYFANSITEDEFRRLFAVYTRAGEEAPSLAGFVRDHIDVFLPNETFVIGISFSHRDPAGAAFLANRYAQKYVDFVRDRATSGNNAAILFLEEQAEDMRARVESLEQRLQNYRQEHNLVSLTENQTASVQRLSRLIDTAASARVTRLQVEAQLRTLQSFIDSGQNILSFPYIADFGTIAELKNEYNQLRAERAQLNQRYLENHPRVRENQRALESLQALIDEAVQLAIDELRQRYEIAIEQEQAMREELNSVEQESLAMDRVAIEYSVIEREVRTARESYSAILNRLNETSISAELNNVNVTLMDPGYEALHPFSPSKLKVGFQAVILAGFFTLALPLGLGFLDNRLKYASDAEKIAGGSLLAEIPSFGKVGDKEGLITRDWLLNHTQACEAFRQFYCQLLRVLGPGDRCATVITSTLSGEGKTFCTQALGLMAAEHAKKTVIIDCDLRHPSIHRINGADNENGIIPWVLSYHADGSPLDVYNQEKLALQEISPNFWIIPVGGVSRNPTGLFSHPAFDLLVAALRKEFHWVLFNCSPYGLFPDSLILTSYVDHYIYLCRFKQINKNQLRKVHQRLRESTEKPIHLVLNGIPPGKRAALYDYYGQSFNTAYDYHRYTARNARKTG